MKNVVMKYSNIDEYIEYFPDETKVKLRKIRNVIKGLVPQATETISYGIPTFKLNGKNLVHFAAYEHHIGFYPTSSPIAKFEDQLIDYKHTKGTIQFKLDQPIPYDLITRIVTFRLNTF